MDEVKTIELSNLCTGEVVWVETNVPQYMCRMMGELRSGTWQVTNPQPGIKRPAEFTHIIH